jgi:hypothetical protein
MERPGARPSLHRLVAEAVTRGGRVAERSRAAVEEVRASAQALERTVDEVQRARERRRFGNGQFDAREGNRPG